MNKQLTSDLIDIAKVDEIFDIICWSDGISNIQHINNMAEYNIVTDQKIINFLNNPDTPTIPSGGSYPDPIFNRVTRIKFASEKDTITFKLIGDYISPENEVTSDLIKIDSVVFVDSHTLEITCNTLNVDPDKSGIISLNSIPVANITTFTSDWIDFRAGGDAVNNYDLAVITQGEIVRDADGIGTSNSASAWAKLLAIKDYAISRDHDKGIQIIYKKQTSGYAMFGMIADGHGVDTSMYNETHVSLYPQNQNTLWGFYSYTAKANSHGIANYDRLKFVFPSTMSPGSEFSVYGLVSADDWDEGTLIYTDITPNGTQDPGDKIYPCITPGTGISCRLQAFNMSYS